MAMIGVIGFMAVLLAYSCDSLASIWSDVVMALLLIS
jgi:hypothetical protein